jgi:hypothetical protein
MQDVTYFVNDGVVTSVTTTKHVLVDANGKPVYEAYDAEGNRFCHGVRGDDLANRINFMTISELIDGYETDAQFNTLRQFLPGTTTIYEIMSGEGFKVDDAEILLVDFLGESVVNGNVILKAIAYETDGVTKVKIADIDDRLNALTIAEIVKPATGNYGEGTTELLSKIVPANTLVTAIGEIDFALNVKTLTIAEVMGLEVDEFGKLVAGATSGDKYIDMLINKGATVGNFATTLSSMSLIDFAGVDLFVVAEGVTSTLFTTTTALYTTTDNVTYTLVDGAFDGTNYVYTGLDMATTYYQVNKESNFWHLMLTSHTSSGKSATEIAGTSEFGAYYQITVLADRTVSDFETNNIELSTDLLKIKYMIDIGVLQDNAITYNGSVFTKVYNSTIQDALLALMEKLASIS